MTQQDMATLAERVEKALQPIRRAPLTVRAAILRYLYDNYPESVTLGQVRSHLAMTYEWDGHEKTPGMLLERLRKEGLAEHTGTRNWRATQAASPADLPDSITLSRDDAEAIVTALRSRNEQREG